MKIEIEFPDAFCSVYNFYINGQDACSSDFGVAQDTQPEKSERKTK